jgi:hypothetical protein
LEPINAPVEIKVQELIDAANGREIRGTPIELFNMTRWQARKCLQHYVNTVTRTEQFAFDATARCYAPVAGDVGGLINRSGLHDGSVWFQIQRAVNKSPQQTSRERHFVLKRF